MTMKCQRARRSRDAHMLTSAFPWRGGRPAHYVEGPFDRLDDGCDERDGGKVVDRVAIVAGGDAAPVLEPGE